MKILLILLILLQLTLQFRKHQTTQDIQSLINSIEEYQLNEKDLFPQTCDTIRPFVGEIMIGEQQQKFRVIFDTGANESWIQSELCRQSQCRLGYNYYQQKNECKEPNKDIKYLDQEVKGCVEESLLFIDDYKSKFTFNSISIRYGVEIGGCKRDIDGVLSLGADRKNNIVNLLFQQNKIKYNTFSLEKQQPSEDTNIKIGIDIKNINNDFIFSSLSEKLWMVQLKQGTINKTTQLFNTNQLRVAVFDSSVSTIHLPINDFQIIFNYLKSINDSCKILFDDSIECFWYQDQLSDHLQFEITFVEQKKTLTKTIDHNNYILNHYGNCNYQIKKLSQPNLQNVWILGEAFMSQNINIFDLQSHKVAMI